MTKLICFLVVLIICIPCLSVSALGTSAKAAILINGDTGEVIYEQNADQRLPMASTTKIMTALLLCENGDFAEISGFSEEEARIYFDMETNYSEYINRLSEDKTLSEACRCSSGIRILRQEPFETLISFIISQ